MRKLLGIAAAMGILTLAGCQLVQQPKPEVSSRSVLDVRSTRPAESRFSQPVQVAVPPEEPSVAIATEPPVSVTPNVGVARTSARKSTAPKVQQTADKTNYKVKKGDTLFRIAKTEYGDGKKWTLIASANPGLSPQSLKTGQTIVIP